VLVNIIEVPKDQNFRQLAGETNLGILPIDELKEVLNTPLTDGVAFLFYNYEDNSFLLLCPPKKNY